MNFNIGDTVEINVVVLSEYLQNLSVNYSEILDIFPINHEKITIEALVDKLEYSLWKIEDIYIETDIFHIQIIGEDTKELTFYILQNIEDPDLIIRVPEFVLHKHF